VAHIEQLENVQLPSREQARRERQELRVMDGGSPLLEGGDSLANRVLERGGASGTAPLHRSRWNNGIVQKVTFLAK
jgi:hypothetical protein